MAKLPLSPVINLEGHKVKKIPSLLFIVFILLPPLFANSDKEIFRDRRKTVREQMADHSIMVVLTERVFLRNGDQYHKFRPNSDFWYLTGFKEPESAIIITSNEITFDLDGKTYSGNEFLFLRIRDPQREMWTGIRVGVERAPEVLGISNALPIHAFGDVLAQIVDGVKAMYINMDDQALKDPTNALAQATIQWLPLEPVNRSDGRPSLAERLRKFIARKKAYQDDIKPADKIKYLSVSSITTQMRMVKSDYELAIMQESVNITGKGLIAAMERMAPGLYEHQIQATIEFNYLDNHAKREGYESIVGSGSNALILHYNENDRIMEAGDLVLMDVGAEYNMYTADITRTVPVNGKFTSAQAEVYNVVLGAQHAVYDAIKPGVTIQDLNKISREFMTEKGYGKYIMHGMAHHLGLDVHDVTDRSLPLLPGMVITVEPGLYIPINDESVAPEYRGIGIRIEDDILMTIKGMKLLSAGIPVTIEEIESVMNR